MPFSEFAARVTVVTGQEAADVRARYIARFVDTATAYYRKHIAQLEQHSDGLCYDGYLWDCLACGHTIQEGEVESAVPHDAIVHAFWDVHSKDKIHTPMGDYWRFPKDAVLTLRYRDVLDGEAYLPTDLYIVAPDLSWTIVFTHEWDHEGQRIFLMAP